MWLRKLIAKLLCYFEGSEGSKQSKQSKKLKQSSDGRAEELALYYSPYIVSVNGRNLVRMTGMYIPDQFWKHYTAEIITEDTELRRRMLEDESFWTDEPIVLRRELDGAQYEVNSEGSMIMIAIDQAERLRETGEISVRGL